MIGTGKSYKKTCFFCNKLSRSNLKNIYKPSLYFADQMFVHSNSTRVCLQPQQEILDLGINLFFYPEQHANFLFQGKMLYSFLWP